MQQRNWGPVGLTVAMAVLWLAAGLLIDGTTFHLGPVLVAGAAPTMAERGRLGAALAGLGLAAATGSILAAAGHLDGPSLLPWGGAGMETAVGAVVGGLGGAALGRLRTRRLEAASS